jgi:hypothetical protein
MPDHIHLLWMGLRLESDQRNGMAFLRTHLWPLLAPAKFQPQAHDHVLRAEDRRKYAFAQGCRYVLENPVRAALVKRVEDWNFMGAVVPGYPKLEPTANDYWKKFWKFYAAERRPYAGNIVRPPFNWRPPTQPQWNGDVSQETNPHCRRRLQGDSVIHSFRDIDVRREVRVSSPRLLQ